MSTTDAGRHAKPDDALSFQAVIEATRRLDELSCARVIGLVAEAVHKAQQGGQPLGTVTPSAIVVAADGAVTLAPGQASPRYAAPEKLRGGAGDRRADVFSLGAVLWEALAHEPLFEGASDEAIKRAVLAGAIRPPSELNANVPAELDAICQRALAAEPANRYQSAKVMAAEIDAVLSDAGYPDDNDAIASYVTRQLAATPPSPSKTAPLPSVLLGPAPAAGALPSAGTALPASQPPPTAAASAIQPPPAQPPAPQPHVPRPSPSAPQPSPQPSAPPAPAPELSAPQLSPSTSRRPGTQPPAETAPPLDTPRTHAPNTEPPAGPAAAPRRPSTQPPEVSSTRRPSTQPPNPFLGSAAGTLIGAPLSTAAVTPSLSTGTHPPVAAAAPTASPHTPSSATTVPNATGPADAPSSRGRSSSGTEPPRTKTTTAPPRTTSTTEPPRTKSTTEPPRTAGAWQPPSASPAITSPPAASGTGAQPPPPDAVSPAAASRAPSTQPPLPHAPAPPSRAASTQLPADAPARPSSNPSQAASWTAQTGTSPSPFVASRPPAQTALLGSNADADPALPGKPALAAPRTDAAPGKQARTEILGSNTPFAPSPPARSPLAATAFLGSNAIAGPTMLDAATQVGLPPPGSASATPLQAALDAPIAPPPTFPGGEQPSFAPPAMPVPVGDAKRPLPAPFKAHPQPRPSIATAETVGTPQLPADPAAAPATHPGAGSTQLGMPPGMTAAPASPGAPLRTADHEPGDAHHADPAQVVALQQPSRDVLAGWGWSTGTTEAIDDDDDFHAAARASRKRLIITFGAALGLALLVAIVAFAFRGSKQPDDHLAARAPAATSPTAPPALTAPATDPGASPTPAPPATPSPPTPDTRPTPATDPSANLAASPPSATAPSATAPSATAPAPAPPSRDPARVAVEAPRPADPAKPAKPAKPAEPTDDNHKPAKRPPEPKKADLAAKRPAPVPEPKHPAEHPTRPAPRAQPIDPYATGPSDKPRPDPSVAYRAGLQQYAHGDASGALATFRASLSSNPGFAPTWRGLGLVYEKLGNKSQARSSFRRYLQLAPTAPDADQIRDRLERLGS